MGDIEGEASTPDTPAPDPRAMPPHGSSRRVSRSGPVVGCAALFAVLGMGVLVGGVVGVGPLAATIPPDQVTDPGEMLARSLQSTIDASSVHLEGSLAGSLPGALLDRPEATVVLDGTTAEGDLRPRDAKTRSSLSIPALAITLDHVSSWDSVWYRTAPDEPWTKASLGGVAAGAGLDINPLTLVDRLRGFLAQPGIDPVARTIPCDAPSGLCRHVTLEGGTDPAELVGALLPAGNAEDLPPITTTVTLDADAKTLRPHHLVFDMASEDGTVDLELVLDASRWDEDIPIQEPAGG